MPGGWEWLIIIGVLVLLFGAKRLPEMARSVGQSARVFKGEMKGMKDDDQRDRPAAPTTQAPTTQAQPPAAQPPVTQPQATLPPPAALPPSNGSTANGTATPVERQGEPVRPDTER